VIPELSRRQATIDVLGPFAVVESCCDDLVSSLLEVSPLDFGVIEGQVAWHRSSKAFFRQRDSGGLVIPAGSIPRIIEALRGRQIGVHLRDHRAVLPRVIARNNELENERSARSARLVDAVERSAGGVIVAASQSLRLQAVAELCRHFCEARFLLPFATVGVCRAFAEGLQRRRKVHVSCVYRWTVAGYRGVVLESLQVGCTRCTSREALGRFFAALSGCRSAPPAPPAISSSARRREQDRVERELASEGLQKSARN
jgi:hypothetical protein